MQIVSSVRRSAANISRPSPSLVAAFWRVFAGRDMPDEIRRVGDGGGTKTRCTFNSSGLVAVVMCEMPLRLTGPQNIDAVDAGWSEARPALPGKRPASSVRDVTFVFRDGQPAAATLPAANLQCFARVVRGAQASFTVSNYLYHGYKINDTLRTSERSTDGL